MHSDLRPRSAAALVFASMGTLILVAGAVLVLASCANPGETALLNADSEPPTEPVSTPEPRKDPTKAGREGPGQGEMAGQAATKVEEMEVRGGTAGGLLGSVARYANDASSAFPQSLAAGSSGGVEWNTERYDPIASTGFASPADSPLSTFSIDVDTASYANIRRFLREGTRPPRGAVRIEEMVNYFTYPSHARPGEDPFSVESEIFVSPWAKENRLVRIEIVGRELPRDAVPPRNLVFLLDVSGSMQGPDRLDLVKSGLKQLTEMLRPIDRVSIVVYAGASGLVLPPTPGDQQSTILAALDRLAAGGSTHGAAGIRLAYETATRHFDPEGINRVILATDGDFNVGTTSRSELVDLIEAKRETGVFLTVLGVGRGNLNDAGMEALADKGNGNYAYLDSPGEARRVLVDQANSTLVTIAKDVKIQVEFNPARVAGYRLLGYENRKLEDRDFNDDRKDAGEIGAGHHVTALYEIVPTGGEIDAAVDPLRYQRPPALRDAAHSDEWLTVKLRYKAPSESESKLISAPLIGLPHSIEGASESGRFSAAVALFGMLLRESPFVGEGNLELVEALTQQSLGRDERGERAEFLQLVAWARALEA